MTTILSLRDCYLKDAGNFTAGHVCITSDETASILIGRGYAIPAGTLEDIELAAEKLTCVSCKRFIPCPNGQWSIESMKEMDPGECDTCRDLRIQGEKRKERAEIAAKRRAAMISLGGRLVSGKKWNGPYRINPKQAAEAPYMVSLKKKYGAKEVDMMDLRCRGWEIEKLAKYFSTTPDEVRETLLSVSGRMSAERHMDDAQLGMFRERWLHLEGEP